MAPFDGGKSVRISWSIACSFSASGVFFFGLCSAVRSVWVGLATTAYDACVVCAAGVAAVGWAAFSAVMSVACVGVSVAGGVVSIGRGILVTVCAVCWLSCDVIVVVFAVGSSMGDCGCGAVSNVGPMASSLLNRDLRWVFDPVSSVLVGVVMIK